MSTSNVEDVFFLTFTALKADGSEVELVPGGSNRFVTDGNKAEYIDLLVAYKLQTETDRAFQVIMKRLLLSWGVTATLSRVCVLQALAAGLSDVLPMQVLRLLTIDELSKAVSGEASIDVGDLQSHFRCGDGYKRDDVVLQWLFRCLESWPARNKAKYALFFQAH